MYSQSLGALETIRIFLPPLLLLEAAIQDFKNRELDASAWLPLVILGIVYIGVELLDSSCLMDIVAKLVVTLTTVFLPYFLNLYEIGDAVIMAGLSLTHISTTRPFLRGSFLRIFFPDFGLTILWDTEIIMLLTALSKTLCNLALRRPVRFLLEEKVGVGIAHSNTIKRYFEAFLKQNTPFVSLLLPGYVVTLLFGSIIPLPLEQ